VYIMFNSLVGGVSKLNGRSEREGGWEGGAHGVLNAGHRIAADQGWRGIGRPVRLKCRG
jgi:hypothetical protein